MGTFEVECAIAKTPRGDSSIIQLSYQIKAMWTKSEGSLFFNK